MKIYAIFLPQFHAIPENDKWWGKGFTEWVKVKSAKPLFRGHEQPVEPLNDNYYNLLDRSTRVWHESLLKDYNIDGLIYYHYYFDGKHLLEKPAEDLLNDKSVRYDFFFCWPSESWRRSWNGKQDILISQTFSEEYWDDHINYLLQFFKDDRYVKYENKPLFMLHNTEDVRKHPDMIDYFDKKCKEAGFAGIGIVEVFRYGDFAEFKRNSLKQTVKIYFREPDVTYNRFKNYISQIPKHTFHAIKKRVLRKTNSRVLNFLASKCVERHSGNMFFEIMTKDSINDSSVIPGLFFGWDNTPRHSYRGYVITPPDKAHFDTYFDKIKNSEFVIINAMNEWAEGMVIEPTKRYEYRYLEWIRDAKFKKN